MPWPLITIIALLIAAIAFARWKRDNDDWRPFLPGLLATVLGVCLSIAAYEWLFETNQCGDSGDVACVLNANQGLLTALTILLAVVALWVTLLVREFDRRPERRVARDRAKVALEEAADEWAHNLIHTAIASNDGGDIEYRPQLSVSHTSRLFAPEIASLIDADMMQRCDRLRRNFERLVAENEQEDVDHALGGFVNNSMRLLLYAYDRHRDWCSSVLDRQGLQDTRRLAGKTVFIAFRSSSTLEAASRLRREEVPVVCWLDDDCPPGVEAFPQLPRFQDMNHPPHE